jgi:hypothetical protein
MVVLACNLPTYLGGRSRKIMVESQLGQTKTLNSNPSTAYTYIYTYKDFETIIIFCIL